jgi:capsular polysaccharide biosynthesis protein
VRTCSNCGHSIRDDDRFCASCGAPADALRPLAKGGEPDSGAATTAGIGAYLRAVRRFWWVVGAGIVIGAYVALSSLYTVQLLPPKLTSNEVISYSSFSRLLVTSQESSHLRYQFSIYGEFPIRNEEGDPTGESESAVINSQPPDLNTLVRAANLYPLLIESDQVAEFRDREFGELEGSVQAQGIYSFATGNRFELSEIPVIQLSSVASSPEAAIELADKTAKAFIGWMREEQAADDIPPQDRIVVQQMNEPTAAVPSPGASRTMPMLLFVVIVGAFLVLAVLLDRLVAPRRRGRRGLGEPDVAPEHEPDIEPIERPVKVKKTA